jgi:hypothetical protein
VDDGLGGRLAVVRVEEAQGEAWGGRERDFHERQSEQGGDHPGAKNPSHRG